MRISDWSSDVCSSDLQDQPIERQRLVKQQCARRIAVSEADDARHMRGRLAKRRNRRDDIGTAALEPAVRAFAVADPAPVEAKHRMAPLDIASCRERVWKSVWSSGVAA